MSIVPAASGPTAIGQLNDSVEFGYVRDPLVSDLRKLLGANALDENLENCLPRFVVTKAGRKSPGAFANVADRSATEQFIETRDEGGGSDFVEKVFGCGLGDLLTIGGGRYVDHHEVTFVGWTLDVFEFCVLIAEPIDLVIDLIVGYGR